MVEIILKIYEPILKIDSSILIHLTNIYLIKNKDEIQISLNLQNLRYANKR